jgi:hypothetical protein
LIRFKNWKNNIACSLHASISRGKNACWQVPSGIQALCQILPNRSARIRIRTTSVNSGFHNLFRTMGYATAGAVYGEVTKELMSTPVSLNRSGEKHPSVTTNPILTMTFIAHLRECLFVTNGLPRRIQALDNTKLPHTASTVKHRRGGQEQSGSRVCFTHSRW